MHLLLSVVNYKNHIHWAKNGMFSYYKLTFQFMLLSCVPHSVVWSMLYVVCSCWMALATVTTPCHFSAWPMMQACIQSPFHCLLLLSLLRHCLKHTSLLISFSDCICHALARVLTTLVSSLLFSTSFGRYFQYFACRLIERTSNISCLFYHSCNYSCQYQWNRLPGKTRLWNDVACVPWDVKLGLLSHWQCSVPVTVTSMPNIVLLLSYSVLWPPSLNKYLLTYYASRYKNHRQCCGIIWLVVIGEIWLCKPTYLRHFGNL